MTSEFWSLVGVAVLIVITPGVDMALVGRNTLAGGRLVGARTAAGTILGLGVHAGAAVVGLSVVIATSATAFNIVKLVGAGYLVWLGLHTLWATFRRGSEPPGRADARYFGGFIGSPLLQGVLTNVLNPKIAVLFMSFLPQFVDPARPATPQIALMAITFIALGVIWLGIYVAAVDSLSGVLNRPVVKLWADRLTGTALVGFGIRLAASRG